MKLRQEWDVARTLGMALLRVVSGFLLFQAGGNKFYGWLGGMPDGATPAVGSQVWIGAWLELICGALMMLGLCTRPAAFLMSGTMAVAYFQFHQPQGTWPGQNGGTPAVMLCFACLAIFADGPGRLSLDRLVFGERGQPE